MFTYTHTHHLKMKAYIENHTYICTYCIKNVVICLYTVEKKISGSKKVKKNV